MTRPRRELLPPNVEPLALRQGAIAAAISVSESTFREMQEQGLMPRPRVFNGALIYIVEEVKLALYNLPFADDEDATSTEKVAAKVRWTVK